MKYRKKQVEVEAITFDELVEYGRTHGANIVDGMPWSFEWEGCRVTHETDEEYRVSTPDIYWFITPNHMLVKYGVDPERLDIQTFKMVYEPIPSLPQSATDMLASKVQPISNIIVAYEKQLMNFDDVGVEICNLFDKEVTQLEIVNTKLEVAKRLIKAVHTGNGTNGKEVEELVKEWERVSGEKING